jgi:uncharacterized protein YciI
LLKEIIRLGNAFSIAKKITMKYCVSFLACLFVVATVFAQKPNPGYDKKLADSLGGNDNGMKKYVLVILKTGAASTSDKAVVDSLFRGHMGNIQRLAKAGKLIVAGPLGRNDKTYRGIFIMNVATVDEAKTLVDTDPAVKGQLLDAEYYPWFGSSALPMYMQYHDKVTKNKE